MSKTELICNLIVMAFSFVYATIILSDRVSERKFEYRRLKTVMALILSVYASFGLAVFAEYYGSLDFRVWRVLTVGFSIFSLWFVVSIGIGLYKMRKDENKRFGLCKRHMKRSRYNIWRKRNDKKPEDYSIGYMVSQSNFFKMDECSRLENDCCRIENDCCKIVNIADARKRKKRRR